MANLMNPLTLIPLFLITTSWLADAQVQVIGTGLTCSNPSPLRNRQALSGANVTLSCDSGLTAVNTTVTDQDGDFSVFVRNAVGVPLALPPNCRVFVAVPANCTITRLLQRVNALRSGPILRVIGQNATFMARVFTAAN